MDLQKNFQQVAKRPQPLVEGKSNETLRQIVFFAGTRMAIDGQTWHYANDHEDIAMGNALQLKPQLQDGESYAGLILGKDGQDDYHLVLLPEDMGELSWNAARTWAGTRGGELPSRRELSLLFANLREQFERQWYWSSEQHATRAQLVWGENFASGIQTVYGRQFRGHARAVRRVALG